MNKLIDAALFAFLCIIFTLLIFSARADAQVLEDTYDQLLWQETAGVGYADVTTIDFGLPPGTPLVAQYPGVAFDSDAEVCTATLLNQRCAWRTSSPDINFVFRPAVIGAGIIYESGPRPQLHVYEQAGDTTAILNSSAFGGASPGFTKFAGVSGDTLFERIHVTTAVSRVNVLTLLVIPSQAEDLRVCPGGAATSTYLVSYESTPGAGFGPWTPGVHHAPSGCWIFPGVPSGALWLQLGIGVRE
ncbi:MAG: hypothetical protein ACYSUI_13510 [Planctomycetota bacterium]|jgi:hypothetical protein